MGSTSPDKAVVGTQGKDTECNWAKREEMGVKRWRGASGEQWSYPLFSSRSASRGYALYLQWGDKTQKPSQKGIFVALGLH